MGLLETTFAGLHSNPGARLSIYLDFDGHTQEHWPSQVPSGGRTVTIPPFFPGVPWTWTTSQLAKVEDVWRRAAEDFAPFDVDITTDHPGSFEGFRGPSRSDR